MQVDDAGWLRRRASVGEPSLRLVCFPHAGRGASLFSSWPDALPAGVEVTAVQLPGRENRLREPPARRLDDLVEPVADELAATAGPPLALYGHSMGALLAFEVSHALRRRGVHELALLAVSGHRAPHLDRREQPISALPEEAFVDRLRRLQGTPDAVLASTELRALVLPVLRADLAVCERYEPAGEAPLDCPLLAIAGAADAVVGAHEMLPWAEQTTGRFALRPVPGNHFTMLGPTLLGVLADEIEATRRAWP